MATYLLLHAFPFAGAMWDSVARSLRRDGHVVHAPDLRGFGACPLGAQAPDLELMVDDLLPLMGADRTIVVGCSMGGYVALALAQRRPDSMAALALVDTKATADGEGARVHRERIAGLAESGGDWSAGMMDGLLGVTSRATRPDVVQRVENQLADAERASVAWAQRAMARRPDATGTLAALDVPVLVVMGEEDTMSPLTEQHIIAEAAADSRIVIIPEAGHLSPLEAPNEVAAALAALAAD